MKRMKTLTGLFAAVALSVSALVTPVAVAQTEASEQVNEVTAPVVAPNSDDRSQQCNLDYNSQTVFKEDGSVEEHNSKVYNPFEPQYLPESAGFLEVHGWGENRRIITGTVYPVKNAVLSVTFPADTDMNQLNFSAETNFLWDGREGYGTFGDVYKNKVTDVSNRTVNGTTVTINLGDLAAGAALNLMAQGLVIQGQVDAKLTGTWDPLDVANTPNLGEQYKGIVEQVRPDCFRPQEKPADGDRSNVCEVAWDAGVIVDRRYLDWTNNGYTKKIAPGIFADHVGNMEIQHYLTGNPSMLKIRIPVVTDVDITNAKLTVDLPVLDGKVWVFDEYHDRTFGVVTDANYTKIAPAAPVIEGNTATISIGDFAAGSRFTVIFTTDLTAAELDAATAPNGGVYSNAVQSNATLTGFYPNGAAGTECGYTFGYDDSFTHPGVEVEVNQTGELNPPAGTNYEVILENGEPKVTDADGNLYTGWTVTVDERTGRLTITPPADTAYDTKYWVHVRATTQDGATQDLTAGVQVAQTITKTEIRADGHLWVLVNNQWIDLGKVVGAPGQPGQPGEPGEPGHPGQPGEPGQSITIVKQYINDEGNTVIVFSDGTEVIVNKGTCETCGLGSSLEGSSELIAGSSALLAGSSLLGSSVDDGDDNGVGAGSSDARCVQAAATVGIPLLALLPIGLATQVNIPGLSPLVANAQAQLQSFNTDIQQQSGIHDPNTSRFMAQVNAELQKHGATVGQAVGAAALLTIGGLALKHVVDNCLPA